MELLVLHVKFIMNIWVYTYVSQYFLVVSYLCLNLSWSWVMIIIYTHDHDLNINNIHRHTKQIVLGIMVRSWQPLLNHCMYVHVTLNDYYKHIIYDITMQYIRYRSNITSRLLDTFLLNACSHSTFKISSLQVCSSKITLHLVYNKNFIKRGYLT